MNQMEPKFELDEFSLSSPNKKSKVTNETGVLHIKKECETYLCSGNWLQKYKPKQINELGVQITKVTEIKNLLVRSENKLLILTGPSGCGKTTTLEIVCKTLGFKILEWITPVDKFESHDSPHLVSIVNQFEEFLLKTSRYGSCLDSKLLKTVILVKDFPNIFLVKPSAFHEVLENISKMCLNNPIVFICGENSLCRKLFVSKMKCKLPVIRFNTITDLQMLKILKIIINKERKVNKNIAILCDKALSKICAESRGDIRHCVSKMYIECVKPSDKRSPSQIETPEKSKDLHVDFFHGIGKVFSPKKTQTTPEHIVTNFHREAKEFVSRLNENFYTKFTNIYDLSNAAQRLATSDILVARWQERDIFHEYALSVAVRGTMVSNTIPQEPTFQFYGKQGTCHLENVAKCLQLEGKSLFSDLCMFHGLDDILPFARYLRLGNLNSLQENYLKKTTYF